MKFISTKYAVYMAMMPDLPRLVGPNQIIPSGVIASNIGMPNVLKMSAWGHERKSSMGHGMSGFGGRADFDFGRLEVCL